MESYWQANVVSVRQGAVRTVHQQNMFPWQHISWTATSAKGLLEEKKQIKKIRIVVIF